MVIFPDSSGVISPSGEKARVLSEGFGGGGRVVFDPGPKGDDDRHRVSDLFSAFFGVFWRRAQEEASRDIRLASVVLGPSLFQWVPEARASSLLKKPLFDGSQALIGDILGLFQDR